MAQVRIKPGLIERVQRAAGIVNERAMAGAIGVTEGELQAVRDGAAPSLAFIAGFAVAFGMTIGEVAEVAPQPEPARGLAS